MGHIQNETYTAPDGSVHTVEGDDSITNIKGEIQSNESPSKYQITPEGQIYRVESDGSVTFLGNAEDRQEPYMEENEIYEPDNSNNRTWIKIVGIIVSILSIGLIVIYAGLYIYETTSYKEQIVDTEDTLSVENDYRQEAASSTIGNASESTTNESNYETLHSEGMQNSNNTNSNETKITTAEKPANEIEQEAFLNDGYFYGKIGNIDVWGNIELRVQEPYGILHYDNTKSEFALYESSMNHDWEEYYGETLTGTIHFDYWNLAYKNFARGTYIRTSDGKRFTIQLYKSYFD